MPLQKKHDVLDLLLLLPTLLDPLHPHSADALHFDQSLRVFLYHIQRIFAKFLHNAPCELRPHTLDQAGPKIFLDAIDRSRQGFFKFLHGKLAAVFGVHLPEALQGKHRTYMRFRHDADYSHQILGTLDGTFEHRITVVGVLVCNSFYDTT